jgi:hypothetical protein
MRLLGFQILLLQSLNLRGYYRSYRIRLTLRISDI